MPNAHIPRSRIPSHLQPQRSEPCRSRMDRLRRNRLDQELALGADPGGSASLGHRAAQLQSRGERTRLANALVETLGDARRGEPVTIRVRPQRAVVRALPMTCWGLCCGSETTGRSTSAAQR